jgi:O-antigen/teichoic acid export membrane protein
MDSGATPIVDTRLNPLMPTPPAPSPDAEQRDQRLVLRNTAYLGIAEVLTVPLSVLLNAFLGRYLGPANLGHIYFASTLCSAAILFVSWGHSGPLPAAVALDRTSAGTLLGTSLAWRVATSLLAYSVVAGGCYALGFSLERRWAIGLVFLAAALGAFLNACQEAIRGFERTDIAAYARVGSQLLAVGLVIPVLLAGGGLRLTLLVQALAAAIVLALVMRTLRPIGIGRLQWDRGTLKKLTRGGTPFVFFQLVLVLQPNIDAFYLARLAPSEVVGWYAVSQRLVGFLLIPATALVGSLYPTLCRLHATDRPAYLRMTRESIATVSLVVVPVALGCALYPDIGVSIFGRKAYQPAEDTLRVFALYLFLIYFSMPLGTALLAAGRERIWTAVQLLCVATSLLLDPIFVRYYQDVTGNGGTGLPFAAAVSESLMVGAGILLLPRGLFDRSLARQLALAVLSGMGMVAAAYGLRRLTSLSFVSAPIVLMIYGLGLFWTGAISREQLALAQAFVRRKLRRAAA